jgi:anionic cell wall polymer biosynthesis LytR-Cps2A-Psr (LCP) family protein
LDYESVVDVINILGDGRGIRYDVPMDMFYDPFELPEAETADELNGASAAATESQAIPAVPTEKNHESIDLKAGIQLLNGDRALQLLRYRNYANGNFGRMATQMDFLKEVLRQQMNARNLTRANEIFEKVKSSVVETNMDARTFEGYIETFFSLADFTIREIDYPGFVRNENGVAFFSPDVKSAAGLYRPFRKSADENINSIDTIDTVE